MFFYFTKDHLGARDKLFRVLEVGKHVVFIPNNLLTLHGSRVRVAVGSTRLAVKQTIQVGTNLVASTLEREIIIGVIE